MVTLRAQTEQLFVQLTTEDWIKIRVCKHFYLGTLDISQKKIYNAHKNKDPETGLPKADQRGKWAVERMKVREEKKQQVMQHISSFPTVAAHYRRAKRNKKYLEAGLNIQKMYDLYKENCGKEKEEPVKDSYYRLIFRT